MSLENLQNKLNSSLEKSLTASNLAEKISSNLHRNIDAHNIATQLREKSGLGAISKMLESQNKLKGLNRWSIKGHVHYT
jgi:hypothetical protein